MASHLTSAAARNTALWNWKRQADSAPYRGAVWGGLMKGKQLWQNRIERLHLTTVMVGCEMFGVQRLQFMLPVVDCDRLLCQHNIQ